MHTFAPEAPRHLFGRFGALVIAATLGVAAFLLVTPAAPAHAHDQLTSAQIETTETGEATALKLSFSDNVLTVGTEILVTDGDGADAAKGVPQASGRDVTLALNAPLSDGSYRAVWRVVSSDGHPIEGGFSFDISDGEASELRELDPASEATTEEPASGETGSGTLAAFGPFLGIGAGLAAIVVLAAVIMRARKHAASRDASQHSPEQE